MASITLKETTVARLWVEYSTTIDISKNQSTTTLTLKLTTLSGYTIGSWGDFNGSYFGSTSDTYDGSIPNFSGTRDLARVTKTVNHNSNGIGQLTIYWKWGVNSSWGGFVNPSGSFSVPLPEIPRVTTPALSSNNVNIGDTVTITLNRALASHKHDIAIYFGDKSLMIAEKVDTSYKWTIPEAVSKWIPNAEFMDAEIKAFTYENGQLNGSKSASIKIKIPTSAKPNIKSVTITEASQTLENIGLFVQRYSSLKVDTSVSGIMNATIKSIQSVIENVTYKGESFTTGVIMNAGDLKVSVEVTDSRGRKSTTSKTIKIYQYEPPKIIAFDAKRCDSAGNLKENGTHAKITYQYEITPLENKNSKNIVIKYKDTQVSQYTDLVTLTEYSANSFYLTGEIIALTNSYDVRIEVKDSFTERSTAKKIETERVYADFLHGVLGLAIGKIAELPETFDVDLKTLFRKNVDFKGMINFAISPTFNSPLTLTNGFTYKPQIISGGDLNTYMLISGVWYVSDASNRPVEASGFLIVYVNGDNSVYQKFITLSGLSYERLKTSSGWSPWCGWYYYSGTNVIWKQVYIGLNGRYEAFGGRSVGGTFNTLTNGVYQMSYAIGFGLASPQGVSLKELTNVFIQAQAPNEYIFGRFVSLVDGAAGKTLNMQFGKSAQGTSSITFEVNAHVVGRWK